MKKCSNYIGVEKIDENRTRIKCRIMDGGGKVYENKDPESAEIIRCCWDTGGEGCPFLLDEPGAADMQQGEPEGCESEADIPAGAADMQQGEPEGCESAAGTGEDNGEESGQAVLDGCGAVTVPEAGGAVSKRQEKAFRLHRQIVANGQIAASCMVEMGRDLKTVRDEKLFSEFGCADFAEYCEKKAGIGKRHGYNFIAVFERFGEDRLGQLQGLGIAKLLELARLDDNDLGELMSGAEVSEMSVRELKDKISEYDRTCEQLRLDLDEALSDVKEADSDRERAQDERDELKNQLRQAEKRRKELEEQVARLEESEKKSRDDLVSSIDRELKEKQRLQEENRKTVQQYRDRIKELESRPAGEISEEQRAEIEKAALENAKTEYEKARRKQTEYYEDMIKAVGESARKREAEKYSGEIEELKRQNEALKSGAEASRITAVNAARKQEQEKYSAELEKLRAENAALQSNAQAPAPAGDERAKVKFYLGQIQAAFNAAVEVADGAPEQERDALRAALRTTLERMGEVLG